MAEATIEMMPTQSPLKLKVATEEGPTSQKVINFLTS